MGAMVRITFTFASYCPREGYKVASLGYKDLDAGVLLVAVPVRGIRLHRQKCTNANL